ncbi:hypothetical protein ABGB17_16885 [Sphaerisporangium sp. B11E5]|uniref:hypothetical protein n=1 Tax=Sphaerisporangium sp. B11E5 TaxID=3153563 RepID=UPI00325D8701
MCLAGLGFGLFVAGCLNLPVKIAGIVEMDPVPSPQVRIGMLVIGGGTVLLAVLLPSRRRRRRGLRYLCGVLFAGMLATFGVVIGGTLAYPFVARQIALLAQEGHWTGHLDYPDVGTHEIDLYIQPGASEITGSGRLVVHRQNGHECVFLLTDSRIRPGRALSMNIGEESDTACRTNDGAELHIQVVGSSHHELRLKVIDPRKRVIAAGKAVQVSTDLMGKTPL